MQTNSGNDYEKLAIDIIRLHAINGKVTAVRHCFENKPEKGVVRNIFRISMRVAASLLLIVGSASVYKYITTGERSVYERQFLNYDLTNTRGVEKRESETEAYRIGNWKEVAALYYNGNNKTNKSTFLAGMSEMQLNHFSEAVKLFEKLLFTTTDDHSFQEEAEYYLSLAYLKNHQDLKSIRLINKIKADPNHIYYSLAVQISAIDMKIIALKSSNR